MDREDGPAQAIREEIAWRLIELHLESRDHHACIDGQGLAGDEAAAGDEAEDAVTDGI